MRTARANNGHARRAGSDLMATAYPDTFVESLTSLGDDIATAKRALDGQTGFLYVDRAKFHENFCADVPEGRCS